MSRKFEAVPAVREQTPILFGLTGASGGGKTYSAIRAAIGICEVLGGMPFVVDTDNRRALQYADAFRKADGSPGFIHVPFSPPHGSLDYVDAIRFCVADERCGCMVIDTLSHEHNGQGGMLDYQEKEHARMGGSEGTKMLAWAKPKAARNALLIEIQRLNKPAIFTFRAKEGAKPVKVPNGNGGTKTEVIQTGFVPIGGDEFVYEMTLNALLPPASGGVPEWNPSEAGERKMTKLPIQFESLRKSKAPIDEELGRNLAKWARGGVKRPAAPPPPETDLPPPDEPETGQGGREPEGIRAATPAEIASAKAAQDGAAAAHAPKPDSREERLAERGFSGEGLAPAGDDFPGDRPQASAAGGETAADRPASPAAESATASNATATNAENKPTPSAPGSDFGFGDLAHALAEAKEWADLVAALQSLTKGEAWKAAEPAMQARARAAVFTRLKELMKDGLRMDFTDDAHAFRCYIEFETDGPTLRGNFGAFKLSPSFKRLPPAAQAAFEKAVTGRLAIIEPADGAAAIEGDFN